MRGALVLLLLAAPVAADNGPHREGEYGGVTPGQTQPQNTAVDQGARPLKPKRPPPKGTLTWIGFEAKDGGAEVFFQSVAPFEISQRVDGGALMVHLSLPRLGHNTWRQIDTRFFDNPLSGIVARAVGATRASKGRPGHGAGIDARIAFKNAKDVKEGTVRSATEADGMYYAYLRFPPGTEGPVTTPSAESPPEPADTDAAPASTPPAASAAPKKPKQ